MTAVLDCDTVTLRESTPPATAAKLMVMAKRDLTRPLVAYRDARRALLEDMFSNIEPIDERPGVASRNCHVRVPSLDRSARAIHSDTVGARTND
jgi:hypothetical protein